VAAVVNGEIITTYELDREMAQLGPTMGRMEALSALIEETLILQRVKELGLQAGDEEIEAAIKDIQRQNNLTREQLEATLQAQGIPFAEYRENLRKQILRFKLVGREVQSKIEVSSQEIRDYFRDHIDEYREEPNIHLSRITIPIPAQAGSSQAEGTRAMAEEALARLRQGEDFNAVLLEYSADKRAEGGSMGTLPISDLAPSFQRAVQDIGVGQITGVVESPTSFHLLKVEERSAGSIRHFDAVKGEIRAILQEKKAGEGFKKWAEGLRRAAYIEIKI
jgi:peptidyl-prolyl cis-trans isomerase SurA